MHIHVDVIRMLHKLDAHLRDHKIVSFNSACISTNDFRWCLKAQAINSKLRDLKQSIMRDVINGRNRMHFYA